MPVIIIYTWEGKTVDQKRRLSEAIAKDFAEIAGVRKEAVEIIINDIPKTNWAKGGVLSIDLPEKK